MNSPHRPLDIHQTLLDFIDSGLPFALAQILVADGSTPQKVGVKALIDATGKIQGTLGGGIVEGEAQRLAPGVCQSGQPTLFDYALGNAYARDAGPICGGSMRLLLDPTAAHRRSCYEQAAQSLRQRRRGLLLTTIASSSASEPQISTQWLPEDSIASQPDFPGSQALQACLDSETPRLFESPSAFSILVEPVIPQPRILIAGGGHVGQALAHLASFNGFEVTVLDDRPEFTNPELFPPGVQTLCGPVPQSLASLPLSREVYVVIVTRGHKQDAEAFEACLHAPTAYVGMIGSRRKVAMIRKSFLDSGLATPEELSRVFAPIGFDIGAVTVPEIATSIMAQIIAVRRKGPVYNPALDLTIQ